MPHNKATNLRHALPTQRLCTSSYRTHCCGLATAAVNFCNQLATSLINCSACSMVPPMGRLLLWRSSSCVVALLHECFQCAVVVLTYSACLPCNTNLPLGYCCCIFIFYIHFITALLPLPFGISILWHSKRR